MISKAQLLETLENNFTCSIHFVPVELDGMSSKIRLYFHKDRISNYTTNVKLSYKISFCISNSHQGPAQPKYH